ncbi:twin-arginine translocase TatA/TatE family subunit [Qipengyuania marisflavi]|uniref:Sec-independent protein translocase protein TatA n=1 Tax=Qipengyuania marisflavi TaxID=2486356 RepID=A0A5S3P6B4_9SPHN|nr:twin-arginine translocase TatA/TatE family subunit [Qipengyuania marisflavi]TMM48771.1 twin-arginine translocase TatA/TatE family subunit [Qipengyuania marisflavi]
MGLSVWQLAIIAIVVLVLFGRGKISEMMGDFGKGIKSFKQGMNEEDGKPAPRIEGPTHEPKPADQAAKDPQPAPRQDLN